MLLKAHGLTLNPSPTDRDFERRPSTKKPCLPARQVLLIMKFTAIFLLTASMMASANGHTQITLSERNVPLQVVFYEIKKQSGYDFFYTYELLMKAGPVTVNVRNVGLEKALEASLKGKDLTYEIINKTVVIKEMKREPPPEEFPLPPINISGRIFNENGEPVLASIIVKRTRIGTTSNSNGYFHLKDVDANDVLVISGVGIETTEIAVNGKTDLVIHIKTKVLEGRDIVIRAGYYNVKKREATGNICRVDARTIERLPVSNPLQAMQGRTAGVYIQQATGLAGGGYNIQIRGQNSLRNTLTNNGNLPFYIVDGVPFTSIQVGSPSLGNSVVPQSNPLSVLNPNDIESIEVLKDADATAIYGARGANGVILITTKKGKPGKTNLDVNVYTGTGRVGKMMNLLNSRQYLEMRHEAFKNDGMMPQSYDNDINGVWDTTRYTDWQKELIGNASHITNADFSVSGGEGGTRFMAGGNYYRETTVFPGDFKFQRGTGRFSIDHLSKNGKFNMLLTSTYSVLSNNLPSLDLANQATILAPVAPALYNNAGQLNWENGTWNNPMAGLYKKYEATTETFIANSNLGYRISESIRARLNLGYTSMWVDQISTNPRISISPFLSNATASSIFGSGNIKTWILEPQLEFFKKIGNGNLGILVGTTFQRNVSENEAISATGFTSDALIENIRAASTYSIMSANYTEYKYNALFGRIFYDLKGKYRVNLTGRRDGSSRFGPEKRFANFGALGAAWTFSNEDFVKDHLRFLSFGKLRVSYGSTGSDLIDDYQFMSTYSPLTNSYNGVVGLAPVRLLNPDYSWESVRKFEAGIDIGLFKDNLQVTASRYHNESSNQLVGYPLPLITGQSSVQYNLPAVVRNTGWEFEIISTNIRRKSFVWTTTMNITIPRNKLLAYPNIEASSFAQRYTVGKSLFSRRLIHGTGVNPQTGLYVFEDVNGNGTTLFDTPGDLQALEEISQRLFGGISNNLKFSGVEIDFLFQFVRQTGLNYMASFAQAPGTAYNQPAVVMNRWRKPGDNSNIQRFTQSYSMGGNMFTNAILADNPIEDASFIRLKNLSVSWSVPQAFIQKLKIRDAKIYLLGQNLITITNYTGLDPETQNSRILPPLRIITAGIKVGI